MVSQESASITNAASLGHYHALNEAITRGTD